MTVWICNPFDILPGEGGRQMRYALLAEALVQAGHRVVFWSSDFHHLLKSRRTVPSVYCHNGIDVRLVPTLPYYRNVGIRRLRSHRRFAQEWRKQATAYVAQTEQKPDVIICSTPPLSLFPVGERLAKQFHAKIFLDVMDVWPETFYRVLPMWCRLLGRLFFLPLHQKVRGAYKRADGVSSVSEAYDEIIGRHDLKVFPHGIKLPDDFESERETLELRLCYIGNLGSGYCLEAVMQGMEQLIKCRKAVQLTIAGDGPKRGLVEKYASLYPQIRYAGFVEYSKLDSILRISDVGIVPMTVDTGVSIPYKMADYAGYGLAVLNGLGGTAEKVLSEYDAGVMYQVESPLSFVDAVNELLDNPSRVARMKRNARKLAEEKFDATMIYPDFVRWIEQRVEAGKT